MTKIKKLLRHIFLKKHIVWFCLTLLFPLTIILRAAARANPALTEKIFSKNIYPVISRPISFITGIFPFSVAEFGIYFSIILVPALIIFNIIRKKGKRIKLSVTYFIRLLGIFGAGIFLFNALFAFNYYRLPLADTLELKVEKRSGEDLAEVCRYLAEEINKIRPELDENADGVLKLPHKNSFYYKNVNKAYANLKEQTGYPFHSYGKPKGVAASELMCYTFICGVFCPFTVEANVNIKEPACFRLSTILHEGAHQRGFAKEDEANFLSYKAALVSGDIYVEYSGLLMAYSYTVEALYSANKTLAQEIIDKLCEEANRDLRDYNEFWDKYETPVAEISNNANDTFIKSNDQKEGVKSYALMTDLVIADYFKEKN